MAHIHTYMHAYMCIIGGKGSAAQRCCCCKEAIIDRSGGRTTDRGRGRVYCLSAARTDVTHHPQRPSTLGARPAAVHARGSAGAVQLERHRLVALHVARSAAPLRCGVGCALIERARAGAFRIWLARAVQAPVRVRHREDDFVAPRPPLLGADDGRMGCCCCCCFVGLWDSSGWMRLLLDDMIVLRVVSCRQSVLPRQMLQAPCCENTTTTRARTHASIHPSSPHQAATHSQRRTHIRITHKSTSPRPIRYIDGVE